MTRRLVAALTGACLLLPVSACIRAASDPPHAAPREPARTPSPVVPLRVMPLGDSITDGLTVPGGYRSDLWQFFRADGRPIQFVGSQYGGPPTLGDRDHEGHVGWEIGRLDAHVVAWLRTYQPDVVLLHIGTNDILRGASRGAPQRLARLLGHIAFAAPRALVYVAAITPLRDPRLDAQIRRFNRAIPRILRRRAAAGSKVRLVDMHSALRPADLSPDGIHPSGGGYAKMAARWYAALRSMPLTRWEAEDRGHATVNDGERLPAADASDGGEVGYLGNADSFLQFTFSVRATGRHRVYVRASNGATAACVQRITVDGRPDGVARYAPYGRGEWTMTAFDVDLKAGQNTLRLAHDVCAAEIDSIDITTGPPPAS